MDKTSHLSVKTTKKSLFLVRVLFINIYCVHINLKKQYKYPKIREIKEKDR